MWIGVNNVEFQKVGNFPFFKELLKRLESVVKKALAHFSNTIGSTESGPKLMPSERVLNFVYIMSSIILDIEKFTYLLTSYGIKLPSSKALSKKKKQKSDIYYWNRY